MRTGRVAVTHRGKRQDDSREHASAPRRSKSASDGRTISCVAARERARRRAALLQRLPSRCIWWQARQGMAGLIRHFRRLQRPRALRLTGVTRSRMPPSKCMPWQRRQSSISRRLRVVLLVEEDSRVGRRRAARPATRRTPAGGTSGSVRIDRNHVGVLDAYAVAVGALRRCCDHAARCSPGESHVEGERARRGRRSQATPRCWRRASDRNGFCISWQLVQALPPRVLVVDDWRRECARITTAAASRRERYSFRDITPAPSTRASTDRSEAR